MQSTKYSRGRLAVSTPTAFDYLAVEEPEEEEEEESVEEQKPEPPAVVQPEPPVRRTNLPQPERPADIPHTGSSKGSQKRAAKAALRKQSQQSLERSQASNSGDDSSNAANAESGSSSSQANGLSHAKQAVLESRDVPTPSAFEKPIASRVPYVDLTSNEDVVRPSTLTDAPTVSVVPVDAPIPSLDIKITSSDVPNSSDKENERVKKLANALTRTLWTVVMISGFLGTLMAGHIFMIILVLACQTVAYREVTALFTLSKSDSVEEDTDGKDPWSKTLNWYFFAVTNYFLYGESIIYYFKHVVFADVLFLPFATNHRFISFTLYCIGFVGFVTSLKKQYLKQQFGLFCWVHMTLLVIVVSSHFIVNNILEGLIWFWVPASLVICNDIFAYVCGVTMGRTPLFKLSPKKTVEGFVGAFFCTLLFSLVWGTLFMRYNYMICPVHELGVTAFSNIQCKPNPVFVWRNWIVPSPLSAVSFPLVGKITSIPWVPYEFHLLAMACFASLVAPFGGFFASGFKRAFDIKDFGHSIPGHGGMTDRMDCQFLMGLFSYVYYSTMIRQHNVTVGSLLQSIVSGLTVAEQLELFGDLKHYLEGRGYRL